jgi:hypothetical protein
MEAHTQKPQRGLTFEDVWAMFQETDKKFQENAEQMKAMSQEADKRQKEVTEQMKALGKQMGNVHRSFGDLAEHLVAPNLVTKFRELHYAFTKAAYDVEFKDSNGITLAEVDVWLENGDSVMAVEIKAKLLQKDVDDHLERMGKLKGYADEHGDKRKLLGAVAGAVVRKDARDYAVKSGFYVIEQSGDTVKIEMPEGFRPKAW